MTIYRELMRQYTQRNWYCVPVVGKMPATRNGVNGASLNVDDFVWSSDITGVAVHTGKSRLLVVDVDAKHGKTAEEIVHALPFTLLPTYTVRTGSGGLHYYYSLPPGDYKSVARLFGLTVELRTGNTIVVAAGSKHANGNTYEVLQDLPVAEAPPVLLALAKPSVDKSSEKTSENTKGTLSLEEARALIEKIDSDDYDTWIKVGMALHYEYDASEEAFDLWCNWSRSSHKFKSIEECRYKWESFSVDRSNVITMGSVRHMLRTQQHTNINSDNLKSNIDDAIRDFVLTSSRDDYSLVSFLSGMLESEWRYTTDAARWYKWSGVCWREVAEETARGHVYDILAKIKTVAESLGNVLSDDARSYYAKFVSLNTLNRVFSGLTTRAAICTTLTKFDVGLKAYELVTKNGIVDLRNKTIRPHDRTLLYSKCASVAYEPNSVSSIWQKTLEDVHDVDVIEYIHVFAGLCATGETREQKMLIPLGSGANGKTTVWRAIQAALGDYAITAPAYTFTSITSRNASSASEHLLRLRGARMCIVTEAKATDLLDDATVKALTGGESIVARGVYAKSSVEFTPIAKVVFPMNAMPRTHAVDDGMWRRLAVVEYKRQFLVNPDKSRLDVLLEEEHQRAILAWIIDGAYKYYKYGSLPSLASIDKLVSSIREQNDVLSDWLQECCVIDDNAWTSASALWSSWKAYAEHRGTFSQVPNANAFSRRLRNAGFDALRAKGQRGFVGIRLKGRDEDSVF